jgi:hypothetical protein
MTVSPKAIYKFKTISHQNSNNIFCGNRKHSPEIHMEALQIVKAVQGKKKNTGGILILNFKLYYRAIPPKSDI